MSVNSNSYSNAALKLVAFLAILSVAASLWGNAAIATTLSVVIAVLCLGVLWERRSGGG
ncbi:hypothetical protein D3C72_2213390 [compost metagenome]